MVDPAERPPQATGARFAPMMLEIHAMTEVRVQNVAEREVALERLDQVGLGAAA